MMIGSKRGIGTAEKKTGVSTFMRWNGRMSMVMKLKRTLAISLVLCLLSTFAFAEGEKEDGSVLDWLKQAWEDTSSWASGAWGDASKWIVQAWDDSSTWVTEIWGDASAWVSDTYGSVPDSVGKWWVETFAAVTKTKDNIWGWIGEQSQQLRSTLKEEYSKAITALQEGVSGAGESIQNACIELLKKMNLDMADILKILETITVYAGKIGIPSELVEGIMLPYLVKLAEDSGMMEKPIPAIETAQYLIGVFEEIGVTTGEQAQELVNSLAETLMIQ